MTVAEAKENKLIDNDLVSVKEAKDKDIIYGEYKQYIPDLCNCCGSELATTTNLTKQICVNPRCQQKTAGRAVKMLSNFSIKGIGRVYAENYFKFNPEFNSHIDILCGKRRNYYRTNRIADSDKLMENLYNLRTTYITYADLVSCLALPDLCSRANTIFRGFNSLTDLENKLIDNEITMKEYLCDCDGIDEILADKILRTFSNFRYELIEAPKYFKIKPTSFVKFEICLTGDMNYKHMTKQEFIVYLNMIGDGLVEVVSSNAKMHVNFIVSQYANTYEVDAAGNTIFDELGNPIIIDYTLKHNTGKRRNKESSYKILVTPTEMVDFIRKVVKDVKKRGVLSK